MTSSRSYYEILEVEPTADLQTLKKAFHRLSKILHPDTTSLPRDEAAKKFRLVCEAYQSLSDPRRRMLYDKDLKKETLITEVDEPESGMSYDPSLHRLSNIGNRRPLSGGELFSLLLLCTALCISLLLGIGFAVFDGRELQVSPSWLKSNQSFINDVPLSNINVHFTSSSNAFKSTFNRSFGTLVN